MQQTEAKQDFEAFTLEEARARWADDSSELPIGPRLFLALCDSHKIRVTPKQRELERYVESLYLMGNQFGIRYLENAERPKREPSLSGLALELRDAIDGVVDESKLRLRVHMVPKPLFRENLRKYLPRATWLKLRQDLISERGCTCELCGAPVHNPSEIEAHEEWAYDPDARPARAAVTAIKLACSDCHAVVHFGLQFGLVQAGKLPASHLDRLERHFCQVNAVGKRMFEVHVNAAIQSWTKLNRKKAWQLDFGEFKRLLPDTISA